MMIENEPDPLRRIPTKRPPEIQRVDIGAILHAARLKRGQSTEDVARQTRVPKRFLEALEKNRFDEFPAFVYVHGFLKDYCDHLDVPFEELWSQIQPPRESAAPVSKPAPPGAPPQPDAARSDISAAGALIFAGVVAVGIGAWMFRGQGSPRPLSDESTPHALRPLPRAVAPMIALRALDDAWVRAVVDGVVVFEGRLPRGAAMKWRPSRAVALWTTAPATLEVTVDGKPRPLTDPSSNGEYHLDVQ